jgi:hypothetical protein
MWDTDGMPAWHSCNFIPKINNATYLNSVTIIATQPMSNWNKTANLALATVKRRNMVAKLHFN